MANNSSAVLPEWAIPLQDQLRDGWRYASIPKHRADEDFANASLYIAWMPFMIFMFLAWGLKMLLQWQTSNTKNDDVPPSRRGSVEEAIGKCNDWVNLNLDNKSNLFRPIAFMTLDQIAIWSAVVVTSLLLLVSLLCGLQEINALTVGLPVFIGVLFKYFRQSSGPSGSQYRMTPTFFAMTAIIFYGLSYADILRYRKSTGENDGYFFALALIMIAMIWKYVDCVFIENPLDTAHFKKNMVSQLMSHNFAYIFDAMDATMFSIVGTTFVVSETIHVALVAKQWYPVPFYVLYALPLYFFIKNIVSAVVYKNHSYLGARGAAATRKMRGTPVGPVIFNSFVSMMSLATIILAQGHVCSLPMFDSMGNRELSNSKRHNDERCMFKWGGDMSSATGAIVTFFIFAMTTLVCFLAGAMHTSATWAQTFKLSQAVEDVCESGFNAEKNPKV